MGSAIWNCLRASSPWRDQRLRSRRLAGEKLEPRFTLDAACNSGEPLEGVEAEAVWIQELVQVIEPRAALAGENDDVPPIVGAVADRFTIETDSSENRLDVLANDFPGIAFFRAPTITAVSTPDQGGTVRLGQGALDLVYTPAEEFEGVETFDYVVDNLHRTQVTVRVQRVEDVIDVRLQVTDRSGNPIDAVAAGERFLVTVLVEDLRASVDPLNQGVFASYLNLAYSEANASFVRTVEFGEHFPNGHRSGESGPGLLADFGAFGDFRTQSDQVTVLSRLEFVARTSGNLTMALHRSEQQRDAMLLFGEDEPIPDAAIRFQTTELRVVDSFQNAANSADVDGDGAVAPGDALLVINQLNDEGAGEIRYVRRDRTLAPHAASTVLYLDVNGDSYLTAADALLVINVINELDLSELPQIESLIDRLRLDPAALERAGIDLSGIDLSQIDWSRIDLSQIDLSQIDQALVQRVITRIEALSRDASTERNWSALVDHVLGELDIDIVGRRLR